MVNVGDFLESIATGMLTAIGVVRRPRTFQVECNSNLQSRVEAAFKRVTRIVKRALSNGVVLELEVELDTIPDFGVNLVWRVDKPSSSTDNNVVSFVLSGLAKDSRGQDGEGCSENGLEKHD